MVIFIGGAPMRVSLLIKLALGAISAFMLVRSVQHMRRPAHDTDITGDDGARAGIALVAEGRYEKAIPMLERASGKPLLEVPLVDVFAALGESYTAAGRDDADKRVTGLIYTGLAQKLHGEYEKSEAAFRSALEARPDSAKAHESLGSLLVQLGRHQEAITHLERAVTLDDSKAVTRSNLAIAYAAIGRFDSADLQADAAARLGYAKITGLRELLAQRRAEAAEAR